MYMQIDLECEAELDEGVFCTFVGTVDADRSTPGIIRAECPECRNEHQWDDDSGTNPALL